MRQRSHQWLRDGIRIINDAERNQAMAFSVEDTKDVYFVPALRVLRLPIGINMPAVSLWVSPAASAANI